MKLTIRLGLDSGKIEAHVRFKQPPEPTTHVSERLVLTRRFIASDASLPTHSSVVDQLPSIPCLDPKKVSPLA